VHSVRPAFGPRPRWPGHEHSPGTWPAQLVQRTRRTRPRGHLAQRDRGGAAGPGSLADKVWREMATKTHPRTMLTVRGWVEDDGTAVSEAVAELR
jgi:hypothetical protein